MMRMVAVRLKEGDDLKQAIEQFVREKKLSSATVISAVGRCMRMAGAQPDKQDIRTVEGRYEIVSLIGNLGESRTHLHMAISGEDGAVVGRHLKEGSLVHTTVELVIATDYTLTFGEALDEVTGFGELEIRAT